MNSIFSRRLAHAVNGVAKLQGGSRGFLLPSLPSFSTKKVYNDTGIFNYTPEQIFNVVADVEKYHKFVPMCLASTVLPNTRRTVPALILGDADSQSFDAELVIGYPPLQERYTSFVRLDKPWRIVATAAPGGGIFKHMKTVWELSQSDGSSAAAGLPKSAFVNSSSPSTLVHFSIEFEFASVLHAQAASLAFEKVAQSTLTAYRTRCQKLYGH
ncbi:hypothetical protein BX661DRAFT_211811 [Kickxella alabastrina]|uniref:uncharacterized protein n=1 Tax=Kickxella alabastrina TaxID=61397 RepID=UPI002220B453|nr:uncharacterized protein BX661DRAFT_211811 [Kickxella alabastrina]KAI7828450.1 hypothetical protein BX661DRAFT_211811 [Kickxella alabastrina]